jgi:ribosome-associated translation inhibitor RaiA
MTMLTWIIIGGAIYWIYRRIQDDEYNRRLQEEYRRQLYERAKTIEQEMDSLDRQFRQEIYKIKSEVDYDYQTVYEVDRTASEWNAALERAKSSYDLDNAFGMFTTYMAILETHLKRQKERKQKEEEDKQDNSSTWSW